MSQHPHDAPRIDGESLDRAWADLLSPSRRRLLLNAGLAGAGLAATGATASASATALPAASAGVPARTAIDDSGLLLLQGAAAVKGDLSNKAALYKAMEGATIDSPRGKWTMSKSHNPVQDIYLRKVEGKENKVVGIASKALSDPAWVDRNPAVPRHDGGPVPPFFFDSCSTRWISPTS